MSAEIQAPQLALYRKRWLIETVFQRLEAHLNSEIDTLGYPQAGLLGFCLAVLALPSQAFGQWLLELAACVNLKRYRKTSRGPKKPKVCQPYDPTKPHVSTARVLAQAKTNKKSKGEIS